MSARCGTSPTPQLTDTAASASRDHRPDVSNARTPCTTTPCDRDWRHGIHATPGFKEVFLGNSPKPRLSIGIGVNWISPFGPLRLDLAKALLKQEGDDTKFFSFNVGTQF